MLSKKEEMEAYLNLITLREIKSQTYLALLGKSVSTLITKAFC